MDSEVGECSNFAADLVREWYSLLNDANKQIYYIFRNLARM